MDSKIFVVVGGQLGSEGKGAVAGRIARDLERSGRRVVGVRVGGPNAGHTVLGLCPKDCGQGDHEPGAHPWRLRQVPVAAVTAPDSDLIIAQGSEIDPQVLADEVRALDSAGYGVTERLTVDRQATVITIVHKMEEAAGGLSGRLGSTAKGIGAARAERIWRRAVTWGQLDGGSLLRDLGLELDSADTSLDLWGRNLSDRHAVVIEGTQGYGLGLHAGYYPYCTSGDCRAIDFLAQAGVSPWSPAPESVRVVVCFRPYPIRVAGNSGPLKDETSWKELGLPQELTTVTQKVRRVGRWDSDLAQAAMRANGAPSSNVWVAMTMMDQVLPQLAGQDQRFDSEILPRLDPDERQALCVYLSDLYEARLGYLGTGPDTAVVDSGLYA